MSYEIWNKRLFEHFFNEDQINSPVTCYVDEGVIDEIGKEIGGLGGFVKSVVIVDSVPRHIGNILSEHVQAYEKKSLRNDQVPPFFGVVCLTILAWTVDADLNGGNYYGRLNGLLAKAYREAGCDPEKFQVGLGTNQGKSQKFRIHLENAFKLLEYHTIERLEAELGFYEFRRAGLDYVDIPKAQAFIRAKDRCGLEVFFAEQGVQPGVGLSVDDVRRLLEPAALRNPYLTQVTIARWYAHRVNQDIICEIVRTLVEHWDGTFEIPETGREGLRGRCSGVYFRPTLSVMFGTVTLRARVEFLDGDFPITRAHYFR